MAPGVFRNAVALYQQRRLSEAEKLLNQILQRVPGHADALHLAALIAQETGRPQRAISLLGKAVKLNPGAAPLHDALANALNELGRRDEALAAWDRATQADPGFADAWVNRGALLKAQGRAEEAVASFDRALGVDPNFVEAHYNRALAFSVLKQYDDALKSCDRVVALAPGFAAGHFARGTVLADLRRDTEALASFRRAIALRPDHAEAHYNCGTSLLGLGLLEEAIAHFDRTIAIKPDHADAWHNRGAAQQDLERYEDAIVSQGRALALRPDFDFLAGDLLQLRLSVCDWDGLEAASASIVAKTERGGRALSPFASLLASHDPALQRRTAEIYARAKYPPDPVAGTIGIGPRADRIGIGYFSADFREHPVSYLMAGLFERHDRSRFRIVGFGFGPPANDPMATRIAALFDEYIDVRGLPDRSVAQHARDRGIDIAVDLGGYTRHARPGIFAARAAPVQVGYIGYLGTMGADYYDYILADSVMIPAPDRPHYTEKVAYLASFQCNTPDPPVSGATQTRADAGLPAEGFVFCCFNNNHKILPDVFAAWVRLLNAVPGSILWLYVAGEAAERNIANAARARGLIPERIVFARRVPRPVYLARLRLADLFLDTAPYNAGTTASDALWMGLPVLTRMGTTFAGRMGASLLTAIGLPELIAPTPAAYEAMAIALANDPHRLSEIARTLAANRSTARLFDTERFASNIEAVYAEMAERSRSGLPPDHIGIAE